MTETAPPSDNETPETPEAPGNWHLSGEEVRDMSDEEFREFAIDLQERVGRIYDLEMARIRIKRNPDQKPLTADDEDHILNPENVE